ncbi:ECF RNA polymerase sigma factor SigJ [Paenibacillus allorhizoplanae]|uniref:ECF RNA polymerase sigma factor SigJ n=1 Tax=Paenibacillus allorhizoplanae TaxID=2905648 RepID=A0ABN8GE78_9BACL|nr:RNA polymerase sigma-70 factor [Paenibacillus allorhizoplanae]CAH1206582.1 ECF RNA polymerase sigma factor SigJ [Paenibacillus allorhizoplanae]
MEITGAEASEQIYLSYRPLMFSLAYRMLGSVMDAEDVVQEAFLYANETNLNHVHNPKAYLCKIVTNRCIDSLRSASKKREVYVGPWLPEPLITTSANADNQILPDLAYTHKESLSTAYLLLLQQLSWVERAVFLLREVLQYEYDEIAEIVGKSSTNCRQIFRRAKNAISLPPERASETKQTTAIVEQFVHALVSGNIAQLLTIVKSDAILYSDGGGKVNAATNPILGVERIAKFLSGILAKLPEDYRFTFTTVNGQLGIVAYVNNQPNNVMTFQLEEGQIKAFYIVVNPDKLKHIEPWHMEA